MIKRAVRRFFLLAAAILFVALIAPPAMAAPSAHIRIVLNAQGGAGGTSEIRVEQGGILPGITPPTRFGYGFKGYYTGPGGSGMAYYSETGEALRSCDFTDTTALYAYWAVGVFRITYENMEGAAYGASAPTSHTFGHKSRISDPTKPDYEFFGWRVNGGAVANIALTLGAYDYAEDVVLTAVWNRARLATVVDNATETVSMSSGDLEQAFSRQVENPAHGVTADDLNSEEVKLTMTARDADEQAEGAADIFNLAQGEVLKFYDFSVDKTVTKSGSPAVTTSLTQLPNTVEVAITLGESLRGCTSYRIYRYHNGAASPIPLGPPAFNPWREEEYCMLSEDGTTLVLHTRRLSTYAVVGGQKALGGSGAVENGAYALDVQALVREGGDGPVYKIDFEWGPMRFTYSTGRTWDPDEHRYTDVRVYDWIPAACYEGGNNAITVFNHSNADVLLGYAVSPLLKSGAAQRLLEGVDMVVCGVNAANAPAARDVLLPKVPSEGAQAPFVQTYLRLNGSPVEPDFYKGLATDENGYVKVAEIAVTITHLGGIRTPKGSE